VSGDALGFIRPVGPRSSRGPATTLR
jgi:hypothetical protein